jgi:hypothetical protein
LAQAGAVLLRSSALSASIKPKALEKPCVEVIDRQFHRSAAGHCTGRLRRIQGNGAVWRDGCLRIGIDEAGASFDNDGGESELMLRVEIEEIDVDTASLKITVAEAGSRCVQLLENGQVTRIRTQEGGTVTHDIELGDLETGELIDAYGLPAVDGCFEAASIVADDTQAAGEEA